MYPVPVAGVDLLRVRARPREFLVERAHVSLRVLELRAPQLHLRAQVRHLAAHLAVLCAQHEVKKTLQIIMSKDFLLLQTATFVLNIVVCLFPILSYHIIPPNRREGDILSFFVCFFASTYTLV